MGSCWLFVDGFTTQLCTGIARSMRYGRHVLRTWLQRAFFVALGACGPLLGASGCNGSEHVVLAPLLQGPANPSGGSGGGGAGGSSPPVGGNSQPIDAGDRDAQTSPPEIDSGLNPDVKFDWIETLPGTGTCGPNQYAGAFSCTIEGRPAAPPVVGQIILMVEQSPFSEILLVVTGRLADPTGLFFGADVAGTLDCKENTFDAKTFEADPPPAPGFFDPTGFDAELKGDYDPGTLEIDGVVTIINDAQEVCTGEFKVGETL
jgi:hypothetical protein